jgi:hypothetical protein
MYIVHCYMYTVSYSFSMKFKMYLLHRNDDLVKYTVLFSQNCC